MAQFHVTSHRLWWAKETGKDALDEATDNPAPESDAQDTACCCCCLPCLCCIDVSSFLFKCHFLPCVSTSFFIFTAPLVNRSSCCCATSLNQNTFKQFFLRFLLQVHPNKNTFIYLPDWFDLYHSLVSFISATSCNLKYFYLFKHSFASREGYFCIHSSF